MPLDRFEAIIVDNGSDDETPDVLANLASTSTVKLVTKRIDVNRGPAAARNVGWREASADLVAFIDDDCIADPGWLEAGVASLRDNESLGVAQGMTLRPPNSVLGDWTLSREVREPSPYFEGCNIFFRREALEGAGGFDEGIGWYGEDTAAGWAVVAAGYGRGFAKRAIAYHDVVERGLGWHVKNAYLQGNFVGLAKRYPGFHREAFWRPWSFNQQDAYFVVALTGLALAPRRRTALLLVIPWYRLRRPEPGHARFWRLLAQRAVVDAASVVGISLASWRQRTLIV